MKHFYKLTLLFSIFSFNSFSQKLYQPDIEAVLKKAGKNRTELEKAIQYFQKGKDPLKLKAVEFLIANMDIHHSANYYWQDSTGTKIPFNELDYPDYTTSQQALDSVRKQYKKIKAKAHLYQDIDTITSGYLINNVEQAFTAWKSPYAKHLSFDDFCEYLLPYRVSVEPLEDWRGLYREKFKALTENRTSVNTERVLSAAVQNFRENFNANLVIREEPLPRLSALQLLHRKEGACEDFADLEVLRLRSLGIPSALNVVPYWATSSGRHFLNTAFDQENKPVIYDVGRKDKPVHATLIREPSKVLRMTYAKQKNTLANLKNLNDIPPGFMRTQNYLDVTGDFWEVRDVTCTLNDTGDDQDIVYACVFNYLAWRPTWWARKKDNRAVFANMSKGAVYLPMYFIKGRTKPAGYPVAAGYYNEMVLKPDTSQARDITIEQQEGYLIFRPYKKYKLFYWDNRWKLIAEQKTNVNTNALLFNNVPQNALLLLVPEYSQKKERPFIMLENNQRVWF